MLEILNNLKPFFEDCYREIGIREYARAANVSPPTASKILNNLESEGLLKKREDRNYILFRANRHDNVLKDLSRIYWRITLDKIFDSINLEFHNPSIILFGSLAKLESKRDSDIDIVILTKINKKINLEEYEKVLNRKVHLFIIKNLDNISEELRNNIINGYVAYGELK